MCRVQDKYCDLILLLLCCSSVFSVLVCKHACAVFIIIITIINPLNTSRDFECFWVNDCIHNLHKIYLNKKLLNWRKDVCVCVNRFVITRLLLHLNWYSHSAYQKLKKNRGCNFYHTLHLFVGFIWVPSVHLYASENSLEFDNGPMTLITPGEWTDERSFDRASSGRIEPHQIWA